MTASLIDLRLVAAGIPGLLARRIAHLPELGVVRFSDERGAWCDLDALVDRERVRRSNRDVAARQLVSGAARDGGGR
jgi:hypothetical protein